MNGPAISRLIDAPRHLVWEAFTDAKHLMHWWGLKGSRTEVAECDLRPGGVVRYVMRARDDREQRGEWVYREIVALERLVFVSMTDDAGSPLFLTTVTFAEKKGKTLVTHWSEPLPVADRSQRRTRFNQDSNSLKEQLT